MEDHWRNKYAEAQEQVKKLQAEVERLKKELAAKNNTA